MNDTPLLPVPLELLVTCLLAAVPVIGLLLVGRGRDVPHPPLSPLRLFAFYALVALVLALAALIDDLPMALGLLGVLLGCYGLGVGVEPLYRFLYGDAWMDAHPGVVRTDTARWERAALLLALACLLAAVLMAFRRAEIAEASFATAREAATVASRML